MAGLQVPRRTTGDRCDLKGRSAGCDRDHIGALMCDLQMHIMLVRVEPVVLC